MSDSTQAPVMNTAGTHVFMHNADTGADWECPVDYAPTALGRGWAYSVPRDDSFDGLFDQAPGAVLEGGAVQTGFDPGDHNVDGEDGVLAYLATLDPESGEYARVIELERAGKNRTTITGD